MKKSIFCLSLILFTAIAAHARSDYGGRAASGLSFDGDLEGNTEFNFRYIPTFETNLKNNLALYAAGDIYSEGIGLKELEENFNAELYRGWIRYSKINWELRAGLQKINFGPAKILRSLMWFERTDPRDPLRRATGVKGLLYRYYFLNNSNIWVWGLYGNNERKGFEIFETKKDTFESGGRFQFPLFSGEAALTAHFRDLKGEGTEKRFAVDGNFDIVAGLWYEAVLSEKSLTGYKRSDKFLTVGTDYTFSVWNGVSTSFEYFVSATGDSSDEFKSPARALAGSLSLPLNISDLAEVYLIYSQTGDQLYPYISLSRTYNNFKFNLGFSGGNKNGSYIYKGKDISFTLIYNH